MKPTLIVMAAGMGSRYGGLKQMDPLGPNGETLLEYSIFDALQAGYGKVVFVIRKEFEEEFRSQVGSRFADRIEVEYAFQALDDLPKGFTVPEGRTKPWGTGQAVLACRPLVNEPFTVQNADDYYGAEAYRTMADALSELPAQESCMVGYQLRNTLSPHGAVSRGICRTENGLLTGITERTRIEKAPDGTIQCLDEEGVFPLGGREICSMNFWGFQPFFFEALETQFIEFLQTKGREQKSEWYIPDVVDRLLSEERTSVHVLESEGKWFGVTYPEDRPAVVQALQTMHDEGRYPPSLWS